MAEEIALTDEYKSRTIIHQVDLQELGGGGIQTCIRDMITYAPDDHVIRVVGVQGPGNEAPLGRWTTVEVGGRHVQFMPVARLGAPGPRRVPESITLFIGLAKYRKSIRPTTVQVHRVETAAMAKLLFPRCHVIQFIHGDGLADLSEHSDSFWRFMPVAARSLQRWAVKAADQVHVFSAAGGRRFGQYRKDVRVWRTWYDPAIFFSKPQESRSGDVLWVGRLEPPKDPLLALETLACLRAAGRSVRLTLVGSGGLMQKVHDALVRLDLLSAVTLVPYLPREEIAAAMRRHRVLLMTSHYEGSPRVLIEALACGMQVVATKEADPDGVVRDRSPNLRVASRQPSAIADVLNRVLTQSDPEITDPDDEYEILPYSAPTLVAKIMST
jgi:glycosyltransferase involved in cell wall biosynthesis